MEKYVVEEEKRQDNNNQHSNLTHVELKRDTQIEYILKVMEDDDALDVETLKFFEQFVSINPDHPSREKIKTLFDKFNDPKLKMTNRLKNGILASLKEEYLKEVDIINSKLRYS